MGRGILINAASTAREAYCAFVCSLLPDATEDIKWLVVLGVTMSAIELQLSVDTAWNCCCCLHSFKIKIVFVCLN